MVLKRPIQAGIEAVDSTTSFSVLRGIKPAAIPGIAATDPPDSFGGAAQGTILIYGLNEVTAASRAKAALIAENRAEEDLVQPHRTDQAPSRQTDENFPDESH